MGQPYSPYPAARPSGAGPIPRLVLAGVVALAEVLLLAGEVDELTRHFNRNPGPYLHLLIGLLALAVTTGSVLLLARRLRAARILLLGSVVQVLAALPGALRVFGVRRGSVFEDVFLPAGVVVVVAVLLWVPAVVAAVEGTARTHGQTPAGHPTAGYPPAAPPYGPVGGQPWVGPVPPGYQQYPQSAQYQQHPQYQQNPQYRQGAQAGPPPGPYSPAPH